MNTFKTPAKNDDLRHVDTGLSNTERRQAIEEAARLRQKAMLGERWVCHPKHAPKRGVYNPLTGLRLGDA